MNESEVRGRIIGKTFVMLAQSLHIANRCPYCHSEEDCYCLNEVY